MEGLMNDVKYFFHLIIALPLGIGIMLLLGTLIFSLWFWGTQGLFPDFWHRIFNYNRIKEMDETSQKKAKELEKIQRANQKWYQERSTELSDWKHKLRTLEKDLNASMQELNAEKINYKQITSGPVITLQDQKQLMTWTRKIITKQPSSNSFTKSLKAYLPQIDLIGNYSLSSDMFRLLSRQFSGNDNQALVLKIYRVLINSGASPVIVAWYLWANFYSD